MPGRGPNDEPVLLADLTALREGLAAPDLGVWVFGQRRTRREASFGIRTAQIAHPVGVLDRIAPAAAFEALLDAAARALHGAVRVDVVQRRVVTAHPAAKRALDGRPEGAGRGGNLKRWSLSAANHATAPALQRRDHPAAGADRHLVGSARLHTRNLCRLAGTLISGISEQARVENSCVFARTARHVSRTRERVEARRFSFTTAGTSTITARVKRAYRLCASVSGRIVRANAGGLPATGRRVRSWSTIDQGLRVRASKNFDPEKFARSVPSSNATKRTATRASRGSGWAR